MYGHGQNDVLLNIDGFTLTYKPTYCGVHKGLESIRAHRMKSDECVKPMDHNTLISMMHCTMFVDGAR